jgi:hypothetical protein
MRAEYLADVLNDATLRLKEGEELDIADVW